MNIPKDKVKELDLQQQEMLALAMIHQDKIRQRLLKQAKSYPGMSWLPIVVLFALFFAQLFINPKYGGALTGFVGFCLWVLIQFHAKCINQRLDALIELMNDDNFGQPSIKTSHF
jgi:hypothetical protein